jgi:hypothetical protein
MSMYWIWSRPWWAGHQRLAAGLGPLDRLARAAGPPAGDDLLGVDLQLAAEAAADVGAMTRSLCSGTPVTIASMTRRMCGTWVADHIV